MPQSLFKYFSDLGGPDHGGQLHWPGTVDNFPLRGDTAPDLRGDEIDNIPLVLEFKCFGFELWEEQHRDVFTRIKDRIANGWYREERRIDRWTDKGLYVWLEWSQIYGEIANSQHPGMEPNASAPVVSASFRLPPA